MDGLTELVDATPWVDTHEHLVEERHRLTDDPFTFREVGLATTIPADWTALIVLYALDDLISAGLPPGDARDLIHGELSPLEKWDLAEPWFEAARTTGYLRAVDLSTERLFGLRLSRSTCEEIDRRCRELRRPGYYAHVLNDVAGVQRAQVHTLMDDPFCESDTPDLLEQDLSLVPLVLGRHERAEALSGVEVGSLEDYVSVLDWCFDWYAGRAVAAKCLWAYYRPLGSVHEGPPPDRAFDRLRRGHATRDEQRQVEDFLFEHCLAAATALGLPVKIHTGYVAGNSEIGMNWLAEHMTGITSVVARHPDTTFVLMHAGWPYQEHLIALAKHYPNVVVDLCWAWILAPLAITEFVQRFLSSAPANKLLCFGGDYLTVETVVGHAELARRGLEAALRGLIAAGWVTEREALELVPLLMHRNADRIFPARAARPPFTT